MQKVFGKGLRVGKNTFPVEILLERLAVELEPRRDRRAEPDPRRQRRPDARRRARRSRRTRSPTCARRTGCRASSPTCRGRRGSSAARATRRSRFKWTYHFFWGLEDIIARLPRHVEPDARRTRSSAPSTRTTPTATPGATRSTASRRRCTKAGYTLIDPGRYPEPNDDFSSQIAKFKRRRRRSSRGVPLPPDFVTFCKQALQQGFRPMVATDRARLPVPVRHRGARQARRRHVDRALVAPWLALQVVADEADGGRGRRAVDEADEEAVDAADRLVPRAVRGRGQCPRAARRTSTTRSRSWPPIRATDLNTVFGRVTWKGGKPPQNPVPNVSKTKLAGAQWRKGKKYPYEITVVVEQGDPGAQAPGQARADPLVLSPRRVVAWGSPMVPPPPSS